MELLVDVADGGKTVHLLVRLVAHGEDAKFRPPLNLALVIDRSSSMRGPRMAHAIAAAKQVVGQLEETDRLSVITFDARARVVFGPAAMDNSARTSLLQALDRLDTGVGTNIAAGIKKGAEAIRSGYVRKSITRLILLTDGQPSVGTTSIERLGQLAATESTHGVTTTTMGLGENFDDELLTEIARRGGGGFHYLSEASDIPGAFGRELAGIFAIAATRTKLKIVPDDSVSSVEVLHRLESRTQDDGMEIEIGELASGVPRQVLFRLLRSPTAGHRHCGTLVLRYATAEGAPREGHVVGIELPTVPIPANAADVQLERIRLEVATAVDVAWARRASGDNMQALAAMHEVKEHVLQAQTQAPGNEAGLVLLLEDIAEAEKAVVRSAQERERARKSMRERSHSTLLGHSSIRPRPSDDDS